MGCRLYVRDGIIIQFKKNPRKESRRVKELDFVKEEHNADGKYRALLQDRILTGDEVSLEMYR